MDLSLISTLATFSNKNDANPLKVNDNFSEVKSKVNNGFSTIEDEVNSNNDDITALENNITALENNKPDLENIYPVGSIYMNATDSTNPGTLLGFGTWEKFGQGRVPVGHDPNDSDFDAGEKTGGEKEHQLTEGEMPSHNHGGSTSTDGEHTHDIYSGYWEEGNYAKGNETENKTLTTEPAGDHNHTINSAGGDSAHNNLQPYITVFMWKRTA